MLSVAPAPYSNAAPYTGPSRQSVGRILVAIGIGAVTRHKYRENNRLVKLSCREDVARTTVAPQGRGSVFSGAHLGGGVRCTGCIGQRATLLWGLVRPIPTHSASRRAVMQLHRWRQQVTTSQRDDGGTKAPHILGPTRLTEPPNCSAASFAHRQMETRRMSDEVMKEPHVLDRPRHGNTRSSSAVDHCGEGFRFQTVNGHARSPSFQIPT